MTRHREDLDDLIERVGSAMTFVPTDATLAARVAEHAHGGKRRMLRWAQVAAAAAAMVLVVVALTLFRGQPAERVAIAPQAPPAVEPPGVVAPELTRMREPQVARVRRPVELSDGAPEAEGVRQIDALRPPQRMEIAELSTNSLAIVPVDLAPLELPNLAVGEIGGSDSPKE